MAKKSESDERIKSVIREERRKVRNPLSAEIERNQRQKMKIVAEALKLPTEQEFIEAMRSYGLTDQELRMAIEAWREGPS